MEKLEFFFLYQAALGILFYRNLELDSSHYTGNTSVNSKIAGLCYLGLEVIQGAGK